MRSSRSGPDPLDPGRNGFAHRGLHHAPGIIENSLTSFAAALEIGAGIECDLRLTADDQILVFHDADARRLCGSPEIIGRSTLAGLAHLKLGGHPLPTLDQLLALVAGRAPMLLEAKVDGGLWRFGRALVTARKFRDMNIETGAREIDEVQPVEALARYGDAAGLIELQQAAAE